MIDFLIRLRIVSEEAMIEGFIFVFQVISWVLGAFAGLWSVLCLYLITAFVIRKIRKLIRNI